MDLKTHTAVRELTQELIKPQEGFHDMHLAVLVSQEADGTCTIQVKGLQDPISGVRKMRSRMFNGDIVAVWQNGVDWFILGALADRNNDREVIAVAKTGNTTVTNSNTEIMAGLIPTFQVAQNRILRIEYHCGGVVKDATAGYVKTFLADSAGTILGVIAQQELVGNGRTAVNGWTRWVASTGTSPALGTLDVTSPLQLRMYAVCGGGNATFFATNTGDQGPAWFRVIDEGQHD